MKLQMNKSKYNIRIKTVSSTTIQSYLKTIERLSSKILEKTLKLGTALINHVDLDKSLMLSVLQFSSL